MNQTKPNLVKKIPSRRTPSHQDSLFIFLTLLVCLSISLKNWSRYSFSISEVGVLFSSSNQALLFVDYSWIWSYNILLLI
jgi:hypothetical protein